MAEAHTVTLVLHFASKEEADAWKVRNADGLAAAATDAETLRLALAAGATAREVGGERG